MLRIACRCDTIQKEIQRRGNAVKYLLQAAILFAFTLLGELLHLLLPLPVPAAIYGLVLLFAALSLGIVKLEQVEGVSRFLIAIMGVLCIAPAVNLVEVWADIADRIVPIVVIMVVSTAVVFGVSGLLTQFLLKKGGKDRD